MQTNTLLACWGGLIHDLGKMVFRAGAGSENHSVSGAKWLASLPVEWSKAAPLLDCVRYHHARQLKDADLPSDSPAYIVYVADNIAAAADRRKTDSENTARFDRSMPLSPVFTHMKGHHPNKAIQLRALDQTLRMPESSEKIRISSVQYEALLNGLKDGLCAIPEMSEAWINSLLVVLESFTSTVVSSTSLEESPDISLYDHQKITGAAAACISEYLTAEGETDYHRVLFKEEEAFWDVPAFLLYSADFSGIQKFIYTVATANALRSLRSRSFFLELAMEHYIDELLRLCGMSRANLLYSGGGHCYLLLPNTETIRRTIVEWNTRFNDWMIQEFGNALYLADGWTMCSANDLTNTPAAQAPYKEMFLRVSRAVAQKKVHRYSVKQLLALNHEEMGDGVRECRICGRADRLVTPKDGDGMLCPWCRRFEELSEKIMSKQVLSVSCESSKEAVPLPCMEGTAYLCFTDEESVRRVLKQTDSIVRVYTINQICTGLRYSTRLFVGNYAASNRMDVLASQAQGISRIGICRMDVDDLGQAFISGFEHPEQSEADKRFYYVTLSRTSAFSRQMSLFFRFYINAVLDGTYQNKLPLQAAIVYSGGDDVFLVGAWDDVIEAAQRIREAFCAYTCGTLTISCGIGMFHDHYPIRMAAYQTKELEDASKAHPGKNAITLFDTGAEYIYDWETFQTGILAEKLSTMETFFVDFEQERGNAFLYQMMELLRTANQKDGRLSLARYAYLLARLEPPKDDPKYKRYKTFSDNMYDWASTRENRAQLILSFLLYVYQNRGERTENGISTK